jgi:predicted TIM-barrel fold metal-dependent hydrolase
MSRAMISADRSASAIRAQLDHPVVDFDGHTIEFLPAFFDYLRDVAGPRVVDKVFSRSAIGSSGLNWPFDRITSSTAPANWYMTSEDERRRHLVVRPAWWTLPTRNTLDRATATAPRLLYERLDEFGIDFAVVYPTVGITFTHIEDDEVRAAACLALNRFHADLFSPYSDRLAPVAAIPMHTPSEGIEALNDAAGLGMKAIMIPSYVKRPIQGVTENHPELSRYAFWLDFLGIDSLYDYDPFWEQCVKLRLPPTSHSHSAGWGSRISTSSFMYNHLGMFAAAGEASCKSLFFGGVPDRFPTLKFAFLEGGVSWAVNLLYELQGHWDKRNRSAVKNYDPAALDVELYRSLLGKYGEPGIRSHVDEGSLGLEFFASAEPAESLDEFAASGVHGREDITRVFARNFYFGCEADDPMVALAFGRIGPGINAVMGSDIGHWDVVDMAHVLGEVVEAVEAGQLTAENVRDLLYTNPMRFYVESNPEFFQHTVLEGRAREFTQ